MRSVRDRAMTCGEIDLESERKFMVSGFADEEEGNFLRHVATACEVNVNDFARIKHVRPGECGHRAGEMIYGQPCERLVIESIAGCTAFRITLLCTDARWDTSLERPVVVLQAAE